MDKYNIVAENPESTVVAEYEAIYKREVTYQTEDQLEKAFVNNSKPRPTSIYLSAAKRSLSITFANSYKN